MNAFDLYTDGYSEYRSENFLKVKSTLETLRLFSVLNPRREQDRAIAWVFLHSLAEYNLLLEVEMPHLFQYFCALEPPPSPAALDEVEALGIEHAFTEDGGHDDEQRN